MLKRTDLHDYQNFCVDFIKRNPVAALLLGCGCGKTSITLTAILDLMYSDFEVRKVLVVAPIRVAQTSWPDEVKKWEHLRGLRVAVAVGSREEREAALHAEADVYCINRENLSWLVERGGFDFDMVVLDELSSFKNWQSKRFRAFMKVRPRVRRVVGLTGTPSSNGLMDLYAEYRCLDMGERLGRFIGRFREAFFRPDKRNGNVVFSYSLLPGAEEEIYRRISDITVSMKTTDHLKMPRLFVADREVEMGVEERARYDDLRKDLVLSLPGGEVTAANAASLSGKLLQMAGGAVYTNPDEAGGDVAEIHQRKLDALEDVLEAMNGRPLLVAYWFRHEADRIEARLRRIGVPCRRLETVEDIRRWNEGEIPVLLLHPASAGHGLNLQKGGDTICWFSLPWSLELYEQTNDRLYRQGQNSSTVSIVRIVARDTIDEDVAKALEKKGETQNALIEAVRARITPREGEKKGEKNGD